MIAIIKRAIGPLAITLAAACTPAWPRQPDRRLDGSYRPRRGRDHRLRRQAVRPHRLVQGREQHKEGCNFQIIGDVKPVAGGKWDGGWIIDPEKDPKQKYDVEITPLGDQKLKVMGYAGIKFLSETMIWTRAPADLKRCTDSGACARAGSGTRSRSRSPPRRQRAADRLSAPGGNPCAGTAGGGKPGAAQAGRARAPRLLPSRARTARSSSRGSRITFPCAD